MAYIVMPDNNSPTSCICGELFIRHIRGADAQSEPHINPVPLFMSVLGVSDIFCASVIAVSSWFLAAWKTE